MAFRVYCASCSNKITPPYWAQFGKAFCNEKCGTNFKNEKEKLLTSIPEPQMSADKVKPRDITKYALRLWVVDCTDNSGYKVLSKEPKQPLACNVFPMIQLTPEIELAIECQEEAVALLTHYRSYVNTLTMPSIGERTDKLITKIKGG